MKRVTISRHKTIDSSHLDVFFETEYDYLITYEIINHEAVLDAKPLECSRKQNHRTIYLDYEGEITNDRGTLAIVWRGFWNNEENPVSSKIVIEVSDNILKFKELNDLKEL